MQRVLDRKKVAFVVDKIAAPKCAAAIQFAKTSCSEDTSFWRIPSQSRDAKKPKGEPQDTQREAIGKPIKRLTEAARFVRNKKEKQHNGGCPFSVPLKPPKRVSPETDRNHIQLQSQLRLDELLVVLGDVTRRERGSMSRENRSMWPWVKTNGTILA